jgi:hypothetical protein
MTKITQKSELLKALKQIRAEYKKKTHATSATTCPLCVLYYNESDDFRRRCEKCPMFVFTYDIFACQSRNCLPVDCRDFIPKKKLNPLTRMALDRVVAFYTEVIAYVENLTEDQVEFASFKPLVEIDRAVSKKYPLDRKPLPENDTELLSDHIDYIID